MRSQLHVWMLLTYGFGYLHELRHLQLFKQQLGMIIESRQDLMQSCPRDQRSQASVFVSVLAPCKDRVRSCCFNIFRARTFARLSVREDGPSLLDPMKCLSVEDSNQTRLKAHSQSQASFCIVLILI